MPVDYLFRKFIRGYSRWLLGQKAGVLAAVPDGPRVLIANHLSLVDGPFLWSHLPQDVMFTLETELSHTPPGRWVCSRLNVAALSPRNPHGIRRAVRHLRAGGRVMVFPEGKITTTGALMRVYPGAAWLARTAGVPLQALWLAGHEGTTYSYFGNRQKSRYRTPAVIHLEGPQDPPGAGGARAADSGALKAMLLNAMRASPIHDRPLARLVPDALRRFGKGFVPYHSGNRSQPNLALWRRALAGNGADMPPEIAEEGGLIFSLLQAWAAGQGGAVAGGWWTPAQPASGAQALSVAGRALTARDVRAAEYWLRAQTGIRLGEKLFMFAPPSLETVLLAVVSPLTNGTVTLLTSPPGVPVRPVLDDLYDRDAQVLVVGPQLPGAFRHAADGSLAHLHAVFVDAEEVLEQTAREIRRVCGCEARLLPRLPEGFLTG